MQDKDTEAINNQRKRRKKNRTDSEWYYNDDCRMDHPVDDTDHCFICAGNKDSA